jgi:hypothetical protein
MVIKKSIIDQHYIEFSQWVSNSQCIMHMWVLTPKSHVMCVCVSTHGLNYKVIFNVGQVLE